MKLATLCYVKKEGKTLMLHRVKKEEHFQEGKWNGLGGKLEEGESPKECVIREVYEESGLTLNSVRFVGFLTFPKFDDVEDNWQVFVYVCDGDFTGVLVESGEGILEWIEEKKLVDLNLFDGDKFFLKWIEEKKVFFAKFIYEEGKVIDYSVDFL